jgi:homoserine kinase
LRAAGIAAVVSGAGPTILALLAEHRQEALTRVPRLTQIAGPGWTVAVLAVDVGGAHVTTD